MSVARNIDAPSIDVRHADLARAGDSAYRSRCPVCRDGVDVSGKKVPGILLLARNQRTYKLKRDDRCLACGQAVHYTDESVNGEQFETAP